MNNLRVSASLRELFSDRKSNAWIAAGAAVLCCAGLVWLALAWRQDDAPAPLPVPSVVVELTPGSAAAMTSQPFTYSAGWQVSDAGADPPEPVAPWDEPAGVVEFAYQGRDLLLSLAPGDYWAYLFITVDGAPANQAPAIPGNTDSRGDAAGYKPLYAPERAGQPPRWLLVHRAAGDGPHPVRVEVWRGWGQTPLRGVAVDLPLPTPWPLWPGVALVVAGAGPALVGVWRSPPGAKLGALRRAVSEHALVLRFHEVLTARSRCRWRWAVAPWRRSARRPGCGG
jgi:hypothetical protein